MNFNKLVLSGIVHKFIFSKTSPSEIPHYYFLLRHFSKQEEAMLQRNVWCNIMIIASGKKFKRKIEKIHIGSKIIVYGFLNSNYNHNGLQNLVLHAKLIKLINFSGENKSDSSRSS
ncbi:hypothetical protein AOE58_00960 [Candidatus Riesia pthiripubis]|uniref:Replication restart protein PriB n=1 Tax=Candidatus Riesia pthiripubis TaxID=428412 RepID=A0A1V0HPF0_9ENTR|nr:hypothetical protein AOE58_00960 [Candidatus Riesia pthiripubis]